MISRVILIGGAGYIGSVCIDFFLKKGIKVICIDNLIYGQQKPKKTKNFNFIKLDLFQEKKILKIIKSSDSVIYLAGLVGDPITKKYKNLSKKINEKYTISILRGLLKKKINHLIFISTCSNYGIVKNNQLVNESSKLNPISLYAKSKIKVEKFLEKRSQNYKKKITILRFATAFGLSRRMRYDLTINQFVLEMLCKKKIDVYDPDTWRPYCHVQDFALTIFKVLKSKRNNFFEIYNVGSNRNNFTKRMISNKLMKFIKFGKINLLKKSKDFRNYRVNFKKLNKNLNLQPKYNIEYGIKEMINFLKKKPKSIKFEKLKLLGNYRI